MAGIESCIAEALAAGSISKTEADEMINRYRELEEVAASSKTGKSAKSMLSDELFEKRQEAKRRDYLAVQALEKIQRDIKTYAMQRGDRGPDLQGALVRMFENFGDGAFGSVRGRYSALRSQAQSEMTDLLWQFRRSAVTMQRFNRPMLDDIAKVMFKEASSPEARALYDSFYGVANKLRLRFNELGGAIKWRADWGVTHEHNATAIMRAGFDKWREFIEPRLDWDGMTDPFNSMPVAPSGREFMLRQIWRNIVSGGWDLKDPAMTSGARMLADTRADPRFLKFKDSASWIAYNKAFGSGDLFDAMMGHIDGLAKDVAMLERLGPNPAATVEWMKQLLEQEAARVKMGDPSMLDAKPDTADKIARNTAEALEAFHNYANGQNVPQTFLGSAATVGRNIAYSAKLGSSVVVDLFADPIIQAMARYIHGLPVLQTGLDILKSIGSRREMLQAGMLLDDALYTLERSAREGAVGTRAREFSAWLPAITTHYSGMNAVINANKRAFFGAAMSTFANNVGKTFDELAPRLRQDLQGYGITAQDWEIMRLADLHEPVEGAPILRWREIATAGAERAQDVARILGHETVDPAATARASEDAALKYLEMLHMATEVAVPNENWRVRSMVATTRPGTLKGEALRSVMMFKGGFMATFMRTQAHMIKRELAANKGSAATYIGASLIGLAIGGLLSLQIKQIINGKDPLPMDPSTEQGRVTYAKALLTSGALGLYGDFFQSATSSYGHGLLETLAGPMATQLSDLAHAGASIVSHAGVAATGVKLKNPLDDEIENGVIKLLRNNTPVLSTHWALRAAYNRMILDQLQYLADPKANSKMKAAERRIRSETNQRFFYPRGAMLPKRLPALTEAAR